MERMNIKKIILIIINRLAVMLIFPFTVKCGSTDKEYSVIEITG